MYYRIRIYRLHDYDLYKLYYTKDFNLYKAFKQALRNYINGTYVAIPVDHFDKLPANIKISIPLTLSLQPKKDKDIIDLLKKIDKKEINTFIKNVTRRYLTGIDKLMYFANSEFNPETDIQKQYYIAYSVNGTPPPQNTFSAPEKTTNKNKNIKKKPHTNTETILNDMTENIDYVQECPNESPIENKDESMFDVLSSLMEDM